MKLKLIALAVTGVLLTGCGSDNDNSVDADSTAVQAFDGAVRYLDTYIKCDGDTGLYYVGETGGNGVIKIGKGNFSTFDADPSKCEFQFGENLTGAGGSQDAVDESNNKDMTNVRYTIPGELMSAGQAIAATPYTTLIALKIAETKDAGLVLDLDAIVKQAFEQTLPAGTNLTQAQQQQLLTDPQAVLNSLDSDSSKAVQAATLVLSDALAGADTQSDIPDSSLIEAATKGAATQLASNPAFPTNDNGDPTYIDLSSDFENYYNDVAANPGEEVEKPQAPTKPDDPALETGKKLDPIPEAELPSPTGGSGSSN
ncbi:hypothetical protein [Vibrio gallicus]|uniref:hypothetical protein n=1 Tax=Vibrio gallicus TaxID=190897 RepID=UPI0021C44EFF|nr:hypothetical protein [Vibrio gallicus]